MLHRLWIVAALVVAVTPCLAQVPSSETKPETSKVRFVVGGKSAIFYLPLTLTERLGYFKEAGLDVEIADVQSGARSLQSLIGGSADVATGTFDHTVQTQAKGQPVVGFVQYGRYPGFVLGTMAGKPVNVSSGRDLKGLKIGVTSPGSSSHFMAAYMLVRAGLKMDDAAFIGTGTTATAVAAARRAEIDAIVTSDPMASLMINDKLIKVVADARTAEGTQAIYGGPYPGGIVYTTPAFMEKNPRTVQALAGAFVRTLRWMAERPAEEIMKVVPEEYTLGNRDVYLQALIASKAMYTDDGRFVPGAAETAYAVLKVFDPAVAAATIDLTKTHTNAFVERAGR